ncbi:MAG TPA: hypothetical protein VGR26_15075 [Acidimicrobiales bacterium]|nr:hypothetical protein [Acidimicrobiales bacterium]
MNEDYPDAESVVTTDEPAPPVRDLGEGDPPPEMVEHFAMEAVPAEGPSDEDADDRELVDPDEAEAESERLAAEAGPA